MKRPCNFIEKDQHFIDIHNEMLTLCLSLKEKVELFFRLFLDFITNLIIELITRGLEALIDYLTNLKIIDIYNGMVSLILFLKNFIEFSFEYIFYTSYNVLFDVCFYSHSFITIIYGLLYSFFMFFIKCIFFKVYSFLIYSNFYLNLYIFKFIFSFNFLYYMQKLNIYSLVNYNYTLAFIYHYFIKILVVTVILFFFLKFKPTIIWFKKVSWYQKSILRLRLAYGRWTPWRRRFRFRLFKPKIFWWFATKEILLKKMYLINFIFNLIVQYFNVILYFTHRNSWTAFFYNYYIKFIYMIRYYFNVIFLHYISTAMDVFFDYSNWIFESSLALFDLYELFGKWNFFKPYAYIFSFFIKYWYKRVLKNLLSQHLINELYKLYFFYGHFLLQYAILRNNLKNHMLSRIYYYYIGLNYHYRVILSLLFINNMVFKDL